MRNAETQLDADGNMTSDGRFRYTGRGKSRGSRAKLARRPAYVVAVGRHRRLWLPPSPRLRNAVRRFSQASAHSPRLNAENRLVLAQELCAPSNRYPFTVSYAYDHRGRMVSKRITENDGSDTLVSSTTYLWDNWNIIREIQWPVASGQWPVVTDNVWGLDLDGTLQGAGGVGGLLSVVKSDSATNNSPLAAGNWQLFLPTYDANGNICEYVTTNGEIVAHYDYSPFGETLVESGDLASSFTHRFSTKPWCPITGLYEYQMRKYRPEIGRWLSRDPITERGGINLCSFLHNEPISKVDPIGQDCGVIVKRITADVTGRTDKYGHEWIEVGGGSASYGWWPIDGVSIWDALFGVPGAVNRGFPQDPHNMDVSDITWETTIETRSWFFFNRKLEAGSKAGTPCRCASCRDILACLDSFAGNYAGKWAIWRSCRTFSKQALSACCLEKGKKTTTTRSYTIP